MKLREYQTIARRFMGDRPRCALWALPGAGKTAAVLHALADLYLTGEIERVLVIAPLRVARDVWTDEVARWPDVAPVLGTIVPIVGTPAERRRALAATPLIQTINYENLLWLTEELRGRWPFDTVVADEASKLRSFRVKQGGKRAHTLGSFAHTKVRRFWELTGTPSANSLAALWGQAWFLDGGQRLGRSFEAFQQRWFSYEGDKGRSALVPLPFAQEQITEALRDICLTIDPKDWFDLREPVRTRVPVKLPAAARDVYRKLQKELFAELRSGRVTAFNAAAKSSKLRQVASGNVYLDDREGAWETVHTAKLEALEDLLAELNEPAVVAYAFVSDRLALLARLPGAVDLATSEGLRRFKAGHAQVGIAHPQSLGHGVDGLQRVCRTTIFYSSEWDHEGRLQLLERTGPTRQHQAGLNRNVLVYDLIATGTVDEAILGRHESKASVQQALLDSMRVAP